MAENRTTTVAAEVLSDGGTPNARVTAVAVEAMSTGGTTTARVTEIAVEVLMATETAADHYFAAGAALEVLSDGDGSSAQTAGAAIEVLNSGDGSTASAAGVAIEVLSSVALAPKRAFDGSKIFEFEFAFQPETIYNEADYDSIYSVGNRVVAGTNLLSWTYEGFTGDTFGTHPNNLTDHNWGLSGGNSFVVGGQDGWPGGAFVGFETTDGTYLQISGIKFYREGGGSWSGFWTMLGGYDGVAWSVNHLEFDSFSVGFAGGVCTLEFTPPFLPFNYWSFTLNSIPESSDDDWPGNTFGNEFLLKVYHSVLDGGNRTPTNGRSIKRVELTHSSGIVNNSASGFDALTNVFDGRYTGGNGGPNPPFGKSTPSQFQKTGSGAIVAPGEWLQFKFPRKVVMREMVWNVGGEEILDSGGEPTVYGKWQWQASNAPNSGFVDVGSPWHFTGDQWIIAPAPIPGPIVPYEPYLYQYWRMVLVEGPALGGGVDGNIFQVQFNLIDPDNQSAPLEAALSDGDTDIIIGTATVLAADPNKYPLTDGDSDVLSGTPTVINNLQLTGAFSDGDSDVLFGRSSLSASTVVQSIAIVKGR